MRCPSNRKQRNLKGFLCHSVKNIYIKISTFPKIPSKYLFIENVCTQSTNSTSRRYTCRVDSGSRHSRASSLTPYINISWIVCRTCYKSEWVLLRPISTDAVNILSNKFIDLSLTYEQSHYGAPTNTYSNVISVE